MRDMLYMSAPCCVRFALFGCRPPSWNIDPHGRKEQASLGQDKAFFLFVRILGDSTAAYQEKKRKEKKRKEKKRKEKKRKEKKRNRCEICPTVDASAVGSSWKWLHAILETKSGSGFVVTPARRGRMTRRTWSATSLSSSSNTSLGECQEESERTRIIDKKEVKTASIIEFAELYYKSLRTLINLHIGSAALAKAAP